MRKIPILSVFGQNMYFYHRLSFFYETFVVSLLRQTIQATTQQKKVTAYDIIRTNPASQAKLL